MPLPISTVLLVGAICAAILAMHILAAAFFGLAFLNESLRMMFPAPGPRQPPRNPGDFDAR